MNNFMLFSPVIKDFISNICYVKDILSMFITRMGAMKEEAGRDRDGE